MASSRRSGGGFGALGFTGFVAAIVASCTTPSFVGWAGAGKAILVGAGTSIGASLCALPGIIGGAIGGGLLGLLGGSKKAVVAGAIGGAVLGGIGGAVFGVVEGYEFSKQALTEGCKVSFNNATEKTSQTAAFAHLSANDYTVGAKQLKAMQPA